jgi:two-component system, OmpR family, alkaline phosphatase synthesis response regulator PhoP
MIGKKVLLVDDDNDLLQLSSHIFKNAGAQVITAHDGLEGIGKTFSHRPNLIILDIQMPGIGGFEVCQIIRQVSNVPVIILTALNYEQNIIHALELGADDFLAKPFTVPVLLARANALLRRSEQENENSAIFKYNDGRLKIDSEKHQILIKNKRIKAGPTEFRLLVYLMRNAGKALTYNQLLSNVWGEEYRGNVDIVHVYISNLRSKIEENPKKPKYIRLVYGVGYIFERQDSTFTLPESLSKSFLADQMGESSESIQ